MFFSEDGNGQRILAPSSGEQPFAPTKESQNRQTVLAHCSAPISTGVAEQAFAEQRLATEGDWPGSFLPPAKQPHVRR